MNRACKGCSTVFEVPSTRGRREYCTPSCRPKGGISKSCKGCGGEFKAYASQNKVYCSASCRYSDPNLRELLGGNYEKRHVLSNVDEESKTAECASCGPVEVRERTTDRKYGGDKRWRCRTAERARIWGRKYGLSAEQVDAMLEDQKYVCAICENPFLGSFHVDHDHDTGKVRGLLCSGCNTGLGLFGDDPDRLKAAARYILKSREVASP